MARIVRLTEADLAKLVRRVIKEQQNFQVSIEGQQPYPNTDWDMVHGYFGSKRTADDLEDRVSKALANGNYRVDNVSISTTKEGASIKTKGTVSLRQAGPNELPHKYFTTRGSIGNVGGDKSDPNYYVNRHDTQVNGLDGRLKSYYKSNGVEVFGPYEILIKGTPYGYKQSFFAIEGQPSNKTGNSAQASQNAAAAGGKKSTLQGNSFPDLRNKIKSWFDDGASIDPNSFKLDTNAYRLQYSEGDTPVKSISLIYDDRGQLDTRLPQILQKNPTMKVATKGKAGNIEWAILYFE
jgi:hypothetical protein